MLQVILHPWASPAVFGKSIHASPGSNQQAVEKFLASAGAFDPDLADEKNDGKDDPITYECASHYEVRETLTKMVFSAEA